MHMGAQDQKEKTPTLMEILVVFYEFDGNNGARNVAYIEILSLVGVTATF